MPRPRPGPSAQHKGRAVSTADPRCGSQLSQYLAASAEVLCATHGVPRRRRRREQECTGTRKSSCPYRSEYRYSILPPDKHSPAGNLLAQAGGHSSSTRRPTAQHLTLPPLARNLEAIETRQPSGSTACQRRRTRNSAAQPALAWLQGQRQHGPPPQSNKSPIRHDESQAFALGTRLRLCPCLSSCPGVSQSQARLVQNKPPLSRRESPPPLCFFTCHLLFLCPSRLLILPLSSHNTNSPYP